MIPDEATRAKMRKFIAESPLPGLRRHVDGDPEELEWYAALAWLMGTTPSWAEADQVSKSFITRRRSGVDPWVAANEAKQKGRGST